MKREDFLASAEGYVELGMYREALDELECVPVSDGKGFDVVVRRLKIFLLLEAWEEAAKAARDAAEKSPAYPDVYMLGAFAIRRAESVENAYEFLMSGEHCSYLTPDWWYKRGCYLCLMGQHQEAMRCVYKAMGSADEKYEALIEVDEDLAPLRGKWVLD